MSCSSPLTGFQSDYTALGIVAAAFVAALALSGSDAASRNARPLQSRAASRIAFAYFVPGQRASIHTLTSSGTHLRRLIGLPDNDLTEPAWSPDGRRLAFVEMTQDDVGGIFVANAAGKRAVRLTRVQSDPKNPVLDAHPRWSPDGRRILFHRYRTSGSTVYIVNVSGKGLRSLGDGYDPSWSPDGKRIAFAAKPPSSDVFDIYVMKPDGTNRIRLTSNPEGDSNPAWSPDGKLIAFEGTSQRDVDIYLMRADGRGRRRLTSAVGADGDAAWSPNGKKIVFASRRIGGQFDLYVMNADGSQQTRLTQLPGEEAQPSWQRPRQNSG